MTEPQKRRWLMLLTAATVLVAAGVAWMVGVHSAMSKWQEVTTEYTEADFRDNAERLTFVRAILPFDVSDDVQVEKIHLVEWLDATFSCVLRLPPDEFQALQVEIEADWSSNQGENRYESAKWAYTAVLDDTEQTVTLHATSLPGR